MTDEILTAIMLATRDADLSLVPADKAMEHAQELADQEGKVVYLRHPETDKVLGKAKPAKAARKPPSSGQLQDHVAVASRLHVRECGSGSLRALA
jgi:hypothetical protein